MQATLSELKSIKSALFNLCSSLVTGNFKRDSPPQHDFQNTFQNHVNKILKRSQKS